MKDLTKQQCEYGTHLMALAMVRAATSMHKFPAPNYTLTKVAEEAGEVVKAGVHLAESRDFGPRDLQEECIDTIAMCFRLLIEGDQVHGIPPVFPAIWEDEEKSE